MEQDHGNGGGAGRQWAVSSPLRFASIMRSSCGSPVAGLVALLAAAASSAAVAAGGGADRRGVVEGPGLGCAGLDGRQDWEQRAGWAAAYRELVDHTDEHDPLGNAAGKGRVEHAVMFRAAHEALALVDAGAEEANLSDSALRSRVRAYERELTWAPRWVDDGLAAAHQAHSRAMTDATVGTARAGAPHTDPTDAARLRADAGGARAEAARLAEQITQLEVADEARTRWFTHTAVTRDRAERAGVELKARGVDPDHACRPDDGPGMARVETDVPRRAGCQHDGTHGDRRPGSAAPGPACG